MRIEKLTKTYKTEYELVHALNNMTLTFPAKGLVFIVGVSGSGKSTLMNMLSGVDTPTSGDVYINGKTLFKERKKELSGYRNSYVGLIFQDYNLIDDMNVYDNICLPLKLLGIKDYDEVDKILKKIDIEDIKYSKVNQISSGQMQRVAIARALVKNSSIILADEPTGNLDSKNTKVVMDLLKEVSKDRLVVVITHDDDAAFEYGDRIIEIEDGKVLKDSSAEEVVLEKQPEIKFKKPIVRFRDQIKFTNNFIKSKLLRSLSILLLLIIIPVIGNILSGYAFFNIVKSYSKYQKSYGSEYVLLADEFAGYTVNYNDERYAQIRNKYIESDFIEVYGTNYKVNNNNQEESKIFISEVNNVILDEGTFDYEVGRQPVTKTEIAITDYFVESYKHYNNVTMVPGQSIELNGLTFQITGIVSTTYENYIEDGKMKYDETDLFQSMAFQENLEYYNAFYLSIPGRTYWWNNMKYFVEDAKYTNLATIPPTITNTNVVIRKLTTTPTIIKGHADLDDRYGYVSKAFWTDLAQRDINDTMISGGGISFICTKRSKYNFSFRTTGMYDSLTTSFPNKHKYEVIVSNEKFQSLLAKQTKCRFLVKADDPNYRSIIENENVINQSFSFAKETWTTAKNSKYVMIQFLLALIVLTAVFAFIVNSMTLNLEKKKIGIKYSFGIQKKTIVVPYLLEIFGYMIIALAVSLGITKYLYPWIVNTFVYTTPQEIKEYYFFYIGWDTILIWTGVIYFILLNSIFIMITKIFKKSPIEMIKDL